MILLRKGLFILLAATLMVSCSDDDDSVVVTPPDNGGDGGGTVEESPLAGTWYIASEAASIAVSTADGATVHWSLPEADVAKRGCLLDDKFIFGADGSFKNDVGDYTWIEPWQGVGSEGCGVPLSPSGSAEGTFEYDGDQITISGVGAYLGLPKVYNTGTHQDVASISNISSVSYDVAEFDETAGTLTVTVGYDGDGNIFTFKFIKDEPTAYAGGVTTCPKDEGFSFGGFGDVANECGDSGNVFTWPTGAADWGGWYVSDGVPEGGWDFSSAGGTITFEATASVATTVNLTFEDVGGGNATTTFGKDIAIAAGTDTYTWAFTASDASSSATWQSLILKILDRDTGVAIKDFTASAN